MPEKPPDFFLKIRAYPEKKFVSVWLCLRYDTGDSGLMWGEVLPDMAEAIAARLDLPVVREECVMEGAKAKQPPECDHLVRQADLFAGLKEEEP